MSVARHDTSGRAAYHPTMTIDLFAGVAVSDLDVATAWYERLLGAAPAFLPNDVEVVWELAEHRYLYVELRPSHAGHAMHTLFLADFDERIAAIKAVTIN